uniref:Cnidarian restricted protein n=1 Tax=Clytia hemisphaerica TaxID=252671 RepID=A0A7M5X3J3_9CNID
MTKPKAKITRVLMIILATVQIIHCQVRVLVDPNKLTTHFGLDQIEKYCDNKAVHQCGINELTTKNVEEIKACWEHQFNLCYKSELELYLAAGMHNRNDCFWQEKSELICLPGDETNEICFIVYYHVYVC